MTRVFNLTNFYFSTNFITSNMFFFKKKIKKKIYILSKYQFMRRRILLFSFDLSKLYIHFLQITLTPGVVLGIFPPSQAIHPRNLRKNIIINKLVFKILNTLVLTNMYIVIRPLCLRTDWFAVKLLNKLFIFVILAWRGRIFRAKRIKKWVKKKYIRRNSILVKRH